MKNALKVILMTKNYILAKQIILYLKGNFMRIPNLALKTVSDYHPVSCKSFFTELLANAGSWVKFIKGNMV